VAFLILKLSMTAASWRRKRKLKGLRKVCCYIDDDRELGTEECMAGLEAELTGLA
jgi:hypothetical protein